MDPANKGRSECLDAVSALSFRLAGRHYLVVKWEEGSFCSTSYTLLSVDTTIKPVAENDYDCDI